MIRHQNGRPSAARKLHGRVVRAPVLVVLAFLLGVLVPVDALGTWWWLALAAAVVTLGGAVLSRRRPTRAPRPQARPQPPAAPPVDAPRPPARTDLIAAVSHDLRTPLATIGAYVELLEAGDGGELTDEQRTMLDVVGQNLRRAYAITDDLLDLGDLERGPANRPEPVTIGDVLRDAVRAVEPAAHERHQRVTLESDLAGVRVAGSARQLDRILANLLSNAVKFTPDGGSVSVFGRVEHGRVVIGVTDTGAGIARAEQQRIFERYYRSDSARSRRVPGTGLGLAIVRELAALHGGQVDVHSTPGQGATFTLVLPALAAAA